jgi:GPH family glycoside/pentoside/hexuronide:cation symporter
MESKKLPVKTKLGFGVCDIGGNIFWTVTGFWLVNFLTDVCGLAAGLAGTAILIGKLVDAFTDPFVGYLSDHTRHRWGRRRPWIFYGSFFLCLMMVVMFTNPLLTDQRSLFAWAAVAWIFLCVAYTLVGVPYYALTPDLTSDYHEQTSLNGYRMTFAVVGVFISAGATLPLVGLFPTKNTGYTGMGAIFGLIILITALITFFSVREKGSLEAHPTTGFISSYIDAAKNKAFLLLMLPYALHIAATTILGGTAIYYFKYVKGSEASTTIGLLLWHIAVFIFIPVWILISKKIGKKLAYNLGMSITAISVVCLFLLAHKTGMAFAYVFLFIGGIGYTTNLVMSWSQIPDVLKFDYVKTGKKREGVYYGLWTFVFKIGQAVAGAMIGWVLALYHYRAGVYTPQTEWAIRLLVGPIPAAFIVLGIILHAFYPITKERYKEILDRAEKMEAASS